MEILLKNFDVSYDKPKFVASTYQSYRWKRYYDNIFGVKN